MTQAAGGRQQSEFVRWMRTGRSAGASPPEAIELKFNPWHDPANGRFTFARAGGGSRGSAAERGTAGTGAVRQPAHRPRPATPLPDGAPGPRPSKRLPPNVATGARPAPAILKRPGGAGRPAADFARGVGEGLYGVAKDTVRTARSVLTTNPATTAGNVARGVANTIDSVIEAEDTPVTVHAARAARAVADASAREIGRATGSAVGNVVMAGAPGAAMAKVAAVRSLRAAALRPTFEPLKIGWKKETLPAGKPWTIYNDGAPNARPGQAPTLMRTLPDGSQRPVKFDGFEGDYMIDRKTSVSTRRNALDQLTRQSEALAQHRALGTWEVPNAKQVKNAHKAFKKRNVTNIKVRIVKP